jgi:flagellar hook-associated protein 3 FlgL
MAWELSEGRYILMRITQGILTNNSLRNLSNSYKNMDTYMQQLSTGKKITRPSQDPVTAMKGVGYRGNLMEIEQYERNISEAFTWIEAADDALGKANEALQRMRELTVDAANETNTPESRAAIAAEMKELKNHLASIGNTQAGDKYIFNGKKTEQQPVELPNTFPTNYESVNIEVSYGFNLEISTDTTKLFSVANFGEIDKLITAVEQGNTDDINTQLGKLDDVISEFQGGRTMLGARQNRIDLIDERLSTQEVIANRIISDNEDVNIEVVITQLKTQEAIHRAALGVGARVMQPSLLDFLR